MLLGPLLVVQTQMACGLATIPSSGKLRVVSQLRSEDEVVPAQAFGLGSSMNYTQALLLNCASRNTNGSEWGKSRREDAEASPVSKTYDQGKQV